MEKLFAGVSSAALNTDVRYAACYYCNFSGGMNPPLLHKTAPIRRGFFTE
jgi:hypothetical protein